MALPSQPGFKVCKRPAGKRALALAPALFAFHPPALRVRLRLVNVREQTEIDIHRLERAFRPGEVPACNMMQKRAQRCRPGRRRGGRASCVACRKAPGEEADRRAFKIALNPGDLPGETCCDGCRRAARTPRA